MMMIKSLIGFLLLFMVFFFVKPLFGLERFREIYLEAAYAKEVSLPENGKMHLSRKGIIDMLWMSPGKWRVTGLKKGYVLLRVLDPNGLETHRVMIHVRAKEKKKLPSSSQLEKAFAYSCKEPGILCRRKEGLMEGNTSSILFYLRSYELCHKAPQCRFKVRLDDNGKRAFTSDLKRFVHKDSVLNISLSHKLIIEAPCKDGKKEPIKKAVLELLTHKSTLSLLGFRCQKKEILKTVTLKTKIFYLKEEDIKQLGINTKALLSQKSLQESILAFLTDNKERILSSPTIHLEVGTPFTLEVGGEAHYPARHSEGADQWKPYGIHFSGVTTSNDKESLFLTYQLKLSIPHRASGFQGGKMSGKSRLKLAKPQILGEFEADFLFEENEATIAKALPIIGPFFSHEKVVKSRSRMYLWVMARKLVAKGDSLLDAAFLEQAAK